MTPCSSLECPPKTYVFKIWSSTMVLKGASGAFKRWDLLGSLAHWECALHKPLFVSAIAANLEGKNLKLSHSFTYYMLLFSITSTKRDLRG